MTMPSSWELEQRKMWRTRNSDARNSFEGERSFSPPAFALTESDLPPTQGRISPAASDDTERGASIRHVHIFDPSLVDPSG
jgi:hypothetical protein